MSFISSYDATRLRLSDIGQGKPVVLVHGWKMSHRAWDRAAYHLSQHYRVISYDLRGMGESDKPGTSYDFTEHAQDLSAILTQLGVEDVTLVGWSMGCSVVLSHLAAGIGDRISRAVLMSGPIKLTNDPGFSLGLDDRHLDEIISDLSHHWPEREADFVRKVFHTPHPVSSEWFLRIALQTPLDVVLKSVIHQRRLDFRGLLARLDIPVLVIGGVHDPYYPVDLCRWAAAQAKHGEHVVFHDSAHCPPIEETGKFVDVVTRFIEARGGVPA